MDYSPKCAGQRRFTRSVPEPVPYEPIVWNRTNGAEIGPVSLKKKKFILTNTKKKPQQQRDRRLPKRVGPFFPFVFQLIFIRNFVFHFHSFFFAAPQAEGIHDPMTSLWRQYANDPVDFKKKGDAGDRRVTGFGSFCKFRSMVTTQMRSRNDFH